MKKILCAMIATFLFTPVSADVVLTNKDGKGRLSELSSDGDRARIEDASESGYVIIDYAAGDFLMVDPKRNEVMQANLGKGGAGVTAAGGVEVSLKSKGGGPIIAGYATRKYQVFANGTRCGTVYASTKLLKNSAVRGMFESMRAMQQQSRRLMQGMGGIMSLCQQASMYLVDVMDSAGAPMRVLDENGGLESEVVKVKTDVKLPASHYQAPAGMTVVSMEEKMNQATQQSPDLMNQVPDMGELLQQLEQSGQQIPEEAMDQLKQLQQQLEQLQQ